MPNTRPRAARTCPTTRWATDDWVFRLATMVRIVGVVILALGLQQAFASIDHGSTLGEGIIGTVAALDAVVHAGVGRSVDSLAAMGGGLHVAARCLEHDATIGLVTTVVSVAIPLSLHAAALYATYSIVMHEADPFVTVVDAELVGHRHVADTVERLRA